MKGICLNNWKDCENLGKTKRDLETRVKEHFRNKKWRNLNRKIAHVQKERHAISIYCKPVLLKEASNQQELTNWGNNVIKKIAL